MRIFSAIMLALLASVSLAVNLGNTITVSTDTLTLQQQPKADSPKAKTLTKDQQLIPIFSNNQGWVKVADPSSGDTGWVKLDTLQQATQMAVPSHPQRFHKRFTREIGNPQAKRGPHGVEVMEYSGTENLDRKQLEHLFRAMQKRQWEMQQSVQQMMDFMFQGTQPSFRPMYWPHMKSHDMPVVQPIVVQPGESVRIETYTETDGSPAVKVERKQTQQSTATEKSSEEKQGWWQKVKSKFSN